MSSISECSIRNAAEIPESSHGWCMVDSHGQMGKVRCVQKHICSLCMVESVNSTYNTLLLKTCLSLVKYFCKHCLAEALEARGAVLAIDFREKSSCFRHKEKNQNKKCDCCPQFKDRTYCVNPSNPDLDAGTRNCFLTTPAKRRCACTCNSCVTQKAQRKEEQLKAAIILKVISARTGSILSYFSPTEGKSLGRIVFGDRNAVATKAKGCPLQPKLRLHRASATQRQMTTGLQAAVPA